MEREAVGFRVDLGTGMVWAPERYGRVVDRPWDFFDFGIGGP